MVFERRIYLNRLLARRGNGFVKIITGVRRCGKSYLLFRLFKKRLLKMGVVPNRIIAIALDDDANATLRDPRELSEYVRGRVGRRGLHYLFIDEIQFCREIPLDERGEEKLTFYDVLNATGTDRVELSLSRPVLAVVCDTFGREVSRPALQTGLNSVTVPRSGFIRCGNGQPSEASGAL